MMSHLGEEDWFMGVIFAVYLFLAALTLMNMLIGILCEVVHEVADSEEERNELARLSQNLQDHLQEVDENYDGMISRAELAGLLKHPMAVRALQAANVDVYGLVDNVDVIFD